MILRWASCVLLSLLTAATAVAETPTRFTVGGSFIVSQPKEEFGRNVGRGYGANATVMYHLVRSGLVNLRLDLSGVEYDHEKSRVPLSSTVGGRIIVEVNTTNSIVGLTWGPEFAVPTGRVRPYVNAAYSRLFFRTTSSVHGVDSSDENIASTTNYKDGTVAWVYGGGIRIPLGRISSPVSLDVGLRYYRGGMTSYLREGSIVDNPDGSTTIVPFFSSTPFLMYAVGVQFRIPHGSSPCSGFLC